MEDTEREEGHLSPDSELERDADIASREGKSVNNEGLKQKIGGELTPVHRN